MTTTRDPSPCGPEPASGKPADAPTRIRRRLRPLYISAWVLGINLWVPVEKLFLHRIGFDAGSIGLLAATYAAVVPFLEIPSGILADRWSRRGVLMIANVALGASAIVGGVSTNVPTYLMAALLLGVYFAMHSGTVDSIVYDVVVEETGSSDGFERHLGRFHIGESVALVLSALAGGAIAQLLSPRATYFLTVPFVVLSIVLLTPFREPRLHRSRDVDPLLRHVGATYRTLVEAGPLRPVIFTMVLAGVLLQSLLEFGPLWLVALGAPAVLFGPQWAGLMSAQGVGGVLAGRLTLTGTTLIGGVGAMLAASVALVASNNTVVVIAAQVVLAVVLVAISTVVIRRLHDQVPSSIRAGVSSGVGTLQWMAFLPSSLGFGFLINHAGVHVAAWLVVGAVALTGASLTRLADPRPTDTAPDHPDTVGAQPALSATGC